jgi:RNA polymerase sigma factor (sigma-70 family)
MSAAGTTPILQQIRRIVEDERTRRRSDRDLLAEFVERRDETAYQALVRRHGPMVLDVCRCLLHNEADAEDAFQATLLVLARKAASVRKAGSLGSWLYGVAYRTALKARGRLAKRRKHEAQAAPREFISGDDPSWREVRQVLHEELAGLADPQRAPLVLCYLQGKTQDEAAVLLDVATSTLKLRLEQGRATLRARLVRRGLGPTAVLVASAWPATMASATVPETIVATAVQAASRAAVGEAVVGIISAKADGLAEGMIRAMFIHRLKPIAVASFLVAALGLGGSMLVEGGSAVKQPQGAERSVDKPPGPAAVVDAPKPKKTDRDMLQGSWVRVAEELNGEKRPGEYLRTTRFVVAFSGDRFVFRFPVGGEPARQGAIEGTFKLDLAASPKSITLTDQENRQLLGIYKIEEDKLVICAGAFGNPGRPTEFSTKAGTDHFLAVYERQHDPQRLQGTWQVVAMEEGGVAQPEDRYKSINLRLVIEGDKLAIKTKTPDGRDVGEEMTFVVDEKASPKAIDAFQQGRTVLGIYALEQTVLKLCIDLGTSRPTDFKTKLGSRQRAYVLWPVMSISR